MSAGFVLDRVVVPDLAAGEDGTGPRAAAGGAGKAAPAPDPAATPTGPAAAEPTSPPPLKKLRAPRKPGKEPGRSKRPAERGPGGADGGSGGSSGGGSAGSGLESAVFRITNQERARSGCRALRYDARLATAARRHSADMAANNYFSHDSQDGRSFGERITAAGYPGPGAENIAKGYPTAAAVMQGWMNSPGHRANILNCKLRAIGVGAVRGSGALVWTQDFGW